MVLVDITHRIVSYCRSSGFCHVGQFLIFLLIILISNSTPAFSVEGSRSVAKLLIFGDSLTAGYGLTKQNSFAQKLSKALKNKGYRIKIIVSSVSGDTTSGGKARLSWALADKPDAVILELGANDGLRGINPEVSRRNLEYILQQFRAHNIRILMAGMLAPPNLGLAYGQKFNQIFSSLAEKYNILFYPFFLQDVATRPELNLAVRAVGKT